MTMDEYFRNEQTRPNMILESQKGENSIPKGILEQKVYGGYFYWDYLSNVSTSSTFNSQVPQSDLPAAVTTPTHLNINDPENAGYVRVPISQMIHRRAERVWVSNDDTGSIGDDNKLFVIESHFDEMHFSRERYINAGQFMEFYNVFELRLRSPTATLKYRVCENELGTV